MYGIYPGYLSLQLSRKFVMWIGLLSAFAFVTACIVLGVQILRKFAEHGQAPELLVGGAFLSSAIGICLSLAAVASELPTLLTRCAAGGGALGTLGAAVGVFAFTRLVFRSAGAWGGGLAWTRIAFAAVSAGALAWRSAVTDVESLRQVAGLGLLPMGVLAVALSWLGTESLYYWAKVRRRVSFGLAEPLLANRMLLYGIGSVASVVLLAVAALPALFWGIDPLAHPLIQVLSGVLGLPIGVIYLLALVPPRRYRDWIEGPTR